MYSEYFSLTRSPFQLLLDADVVYRTPALEALWERVTSTLGNGKSPQFIQGPAGSGKSLFLHRLALRSIELGHSCAYIEAGARQVDLFESLSQAYGLDYPTKSEEQYLTWFESFLASSRLGGIQNVLLLDNIHRMDEQSLQKLTYLIKIRIDNTPLLHVVATYDASHAHPALDLLKDNKIDVTPHVLPSFSEEETAGYLRYRLTQAGHPDGELFDDEVIRWIHSKSRGLPREINFYADLLLTHAFLQRSRRVTPELIKAVDPTYNLRPIHQAVPLDEAPEPQPSLAEPQEDSRTSTPEEAAPATPLEAAEPQLESPEPEPVVTPTEAHADTPDTLPEAPAEANEEPPAEGPEAPLEAPQAHAQEAPVEDEGHAEAPMEAARAQPAERPAATAPEPSIPQDAPGDEAREPRIDVPPETLAEPQEEAPRPAQGAPATAETPEKSHRRWLFITVAALLMLAFTGLVMIDDGDEAAQLAERSTSPEPAPVERTPSEAVERAPEATPESAAPAAPQKQEEAQETRKASDAASQVATAAGTQQPSSPPPRRSTSQATPEAKPDRAEPAKPAPPPRPAQATPRQAEPPAPQQTPPARLAKAVPQAQASPAPAPEPTPRAEDSDFASFSPPSEAAPEEEGDVVPLKALDALIHRFQWAYENGDDQLLEELFDSAIRTNESSGRENILGEYRQFFRITQARRLEIGPMEWQTSGMISTGVGRFTAHIVTAKGKERTFTGTLTIETVHTPDGPRITALFYRYDS